MSQNYYFDIPPPIDERRRVPKRKIASSYDPSEELCSISNSFLENFMRMANDSEYNQTMDDLSLDYDFCEDFTKDMLEGVPDSFYDTASAYELKFYCVSNENNSYQLFVFHSPDESDDEEVSLDLIYSSDEINSQYLPEVAVDILEELRTSIQSYLLENNINIVGGVQTSTLEFPEFSLKAKRVIMDTVKGQSVSYDRIVDEKRKLARFKYLTTDILEAFELDKEFRSSFSKRDKAIILSIYEDYIVL